MPARVTFIKNIGLIKVRFWDDITKENSVETRKEIVTIFEEHRIKKVQVDIRKMRFLIGILELFGFDDTYVEKEHLKRLRFAIILPESSKNDFSFLKIVGKKKGFRIRVFDSTIDAHKWLRV